MIDQFRRANWRPFSGVSFQVIAAGAGAIVHEKHPGKLAVSLGHPFSSTLFTDPLLSSAPYLSSALWLPISWGLSWRGGEGFLDRGWGRGDGFEAGTS